MALRVLVADDHALVREGFRALLERKGYEVSGEAVNGLEAVRLASQLKTDVVLVTMHADDRLMAAALKSGIRAYVLKSQATEDLVHAMRAVVKRQMYLSPDISKFAIDAYVKGESADHAKLSRREREVLQLVAEGKTSKEIAEVLGVSA